MSVNREARDRAGWRSRRGYAAQHLNQKFDEGCSCYEADDNLEPGTGPVTGCRQDRCLHPGIIPAPACATPLPVTLSELASFLWCRC